MKTYKLSSKNVIEIRGVLTDLINDNPDKVYSVKISKWTAGRSLSANGQQHLWYGQIASQRGDITAHEVKLMCKAMFGISVMLASDSHQERTNYLIEKLGYYNSTYQFQMELADIICQTSKFNTKESNEYMDNMIEHFNSNGCQINYQTN